MLQARCRHRCIQPGDSLTCPPTGAIGQRHTQHALDEPRCVLTCVVDPTPAGEPFAAKHALKLYSSLDDMLAAREAGHVTVDGAVLAVRLLYLLASLLSSTLTVLPPQTPNATHVPLGLQLMQAGVHALIEKPFSTSVESGRALVAAEKRSTAKIVVGHHRRFVRQLDYAVGHGVRDSGETETWEG